MCSVHQEQSIENRFAAFLLACVLALATPMVLLGGQAHADGPSADNPLTTASLTTEKSASDSVIQTQKTKKVTQVLRDGYYVLYSKASASKLAVGLVEESSAQGVAARTATPTKSLYQRLFIRHRGNNTYTLQVANSGKCLTDRGNRVEQRLLRYSSKTKKPLRKQLWTVAKKKGGLVFTNVSTGKVMTARSGANDQGSVIRTTRFKGEKAQKFSAACLTRLVSNGTYTIKLNAANYQIDVDDGSWDVGTNAQLWSPADADAQKFAINSAGDGYYRIQMAISGTVLQSDKAGKAQTANVSMGQLDMQSSQQLWMPCVGKYGIVFKNKATGCKLSVSERASNGTNVDTNKLANKPEQGWCLTKTTAVNRKSLGTICEYLHRIPDSGDGAVRVDPRCTGYVMSESTHARLTSLLERAWEEDEDISFIMLDLDTGATVSSGVDRGNFGASTIKGAYVTYIFQYLLETGAVSYGDVADLINDTIGWSDNYTYATLRSWFGEEGFYAWLERVGLGYLDYAYYPDMTARELALIWANIYDYQNSNGSFTDIWRDTFDHSFYSCINEQLSEKRLVYSKPGWYPKADYKDALNDAAIVKDDVGEYLLIIISNVDCDTEQWMLHNLAQTIDDIHREMH